MPFLTHNNVNIYRVSKEGDDGIYRQFSFAMRPGCDDLTAFSAGGFDVRNLPTWQGTGTVLTGNHYPISTEFPEIERAIRQAIDEGYLP